MVVPLVSTFRSLTAHRHWGPSFTKAADSVVLTIELADAVAQVNSWLDLIEQP